LEAPIVNLLHLSGAKEHQSIVIVPHEKRPAAHRELANEPTGDRQIQAGNELGTDALSHMLRHDPLFRHNPSTDAVGAEQISTGPGVNRKRHLTLVVAVSVA